MGVRELEQEVGEPAVGIVAVELAVDIAAVEQVVGIVAVEQAVGIAAAVELAVGIVAGGWLWCLRLLSAYCNLSSTRWAVDNLCLACWLYHKWFTTMRTIIGCTSWIRHFPHQAYNSILRVCLSK